MNEPVRASVGIRCSDEVAALLAMFPPSTEPGVDWSAWKEIFAEKTLTVVTHSGNLLSWSRECPSTEVLD
jgi:hypothetical protein